MNITYLYIFLVILKQIPPNLFIQKPNIASAVCLFPLYVCFLSLHALTSSAVMVEMQAEGEEGSVQQKCKTGPVQALSGMHVCVCLICIYVYACVIK